jgi:hypothetical protein
LLYILALHEAALLDRAPALTARFLTALLSRKVGHNLWDLDQVHTMVSQLIDPARVGLIGRVLRIILGLGTELLQASAGS